MKEALKGLVFNSDLTPNIHVNRCLQTIDLYKKRLQERAERNCYNAALWSQTLKMQTLTYSLYQKKAEQWNLHLNLLNYNRKCLP
jgi:hypothetical protein